MILCVWIWEQTLITCKVCDTVTLEKGSSDSDAAELRGVLERKHSTRPTHVLNKRTWVTKTENEAGHCVIDQSHQQKAINFNLTEQCPQKGTNNRMCPVSDQNRGIQKMLRSMPGPEIEEKLYKLIYNQYSKPGKSPCEVTVK